jgi:predicted transporter
MYTSSTLSSCLRHLIALFLVATDVVIVIRKLSVTVISDTLKNTVFPVLMPCILVHTKVSDSLVGKMLVASSSKVSVFFYETA